MNGTGSLKFLVLQTAFIGDVILATALLEKLHQTYPNASIDILVRKGNETLFTDHLFLNQVLVWDKKNGKIKNLIRIIGKIRKEKYDYLFNCQRYFSSGLFTVFSGTKHTIGFDKNPLSFLFSKSVKHDLSGIHETERNHRLILSLTDEVVSKPKLYPSLTPHSSGSYITISPASVWYTKQFPKEKWINFLNILPTSLTVYLLGAPSDRSLCEEICLGVGGNKKIQNGAGSFNLLQSAALMSRAVMNYVNDSAPMHLCSAVNAPVCVMYCSTVPEFGFGPLSEVSNIIQVEGLYCKPCGLHGYKACPQGHFKCAKDIDVTRLASVLPNALN